MAFMAVIIIMLMVTMITDQRGSPGRLPVTTEPVV
jgi:hypothetical protein